jgi:integrase/recombinase XerD
LEVPRVKWDDAIHEFMQDMEAQGRLNSPGSVRAYRDVVQWHRDDIRGGLVPGHRKFEEKRSQLTGRNDVKRTLQRWSHPNTQAHRHAILQRFYDWCMEEGYRKDNPARQVTRARKRKAQVYRMTEDEVRAFLAAAQSERERRVAYLGVCFGFRNAELRSLQVQNFMREGMVEIVGKGSKYRQMPLIEDVVPIVEEILKGAPDDFVVPAQRNRRPGTTFQWGVDDPATRWQDLKKQPTCSQSIGRIVARIAKRAGIRAHIHPHLMRHAYGDHIARHGGLALAQYLMGHTDPSTTKTYVGEPRFEDLRDAIGGFTYAVVPPVVPADTPEQHTNTGSPNGSEGHFPQQYRQRDSNPRIGPHVTETGSTREEYCVDDEFEWDD